MKGFASMTNSSICMSENSSRIAPTIFPPSANSFSGCPAIAKLYIVAAYLERVREQVRSAPARSAREQRVGLGDIDALVRRVGLDRVRHLPARRHRHRPRLLVGLLDGEPGADHDLALERGVAAALVDGDVDNGDLRVLRQVLVEAARDAAQTPWAR